MDVATGTTIYQEAHFLAASPGDWLHDRIDLIGYRDGAVWVIKGTPDLVPLPPPVPHGFLLLGMLYVAEGATVLSHADIYAAPGMDVIEPTVPPSMGVVVALPYLDRMGLGPRSVT